MIGACFFMLLLDFDEIIILEKSADMTLYLLLSVILVSLDQLTKYLTVQHIELYEVVDFIPNVLSFTYIRNTGAAWNILEGQMWFFYIITAIVVLVLLYHMYTEGQSDKIFGIILSVILAGAIGNFIDRLLHQYVIDMIKFEFINFPIFNLADVFLSVGVTVLFIYSIYQERNTYKN